MDLGLARAHLVVVGSGLYGLTVAERAAAHGAQVVVLERRPHLGGNAWSEPDPATGINVHRYGSHIFHTSNEQVWAYINRFTRFNSYQHRVFTRHHDQVFPMPISMATMTQFYGRYLSPSDARSLVTEQASELKGAHPENLEEKAISLIGRPLYEAFIRGYTLKQWQTDPRLLPPEVITRLPVRYTYDTRYFSDTYEGIPVDGYGTMLLQLASSENVRVCTGVDFFDVRDDVPPETPVVYTGPIDRYFDRRLGSLSWRTLDLATEVVETDDFQGTTVMNYADPGVPYTRTHEFKHFHPERTHAPGVTVVMHETSRTAGTADEPYYPVNTAEDRRRLQGYRELAQAQSSTFFGGRLGSYQYLDMHMAIAAALAAFNNRIGPALRLSAVRS